MVENGALLRLMTWLSPSFPVGAFSYSHGLEWVVETADVGNADTLAAWIEDVLRHGGGRGDAVLFAAAWRAARPYDLDALRDVAEVARALSPTRERALETEAQGAAFLRAVKGAWPTAAILEDAPYPVAVGSAAAIAGVPLEPALAAYLHAVAANLVSAGVRLIPLGQSQGVGVLAALEPFLLEQARWAAGSSLDDLGGFAFAADIASMRHETQYTRLFRS